MTRTLPAQLAAIALLSLLPCCLVAGPNSQTRSDGAVFITPQNGAIVRPGELLHIEISVTPGKLVDGPVLIESPLGFSNEMRESPPYSFTVTISREDTVGTGIPLPSVEIMYIPASHTGMVTLPISGNGTRLTLII